MRLFKIIGKYLHYKRKENI